MPLRKPKLPSREMRSALSDPLSRGLGIGHCDCPEIERSYRDCRTTPKHRAERHGTAKNYSNATYHLRSHPQVCESRLNYTNAILIRMITGSIITIKMTGKM